MMDLASILRDTERVELARLLHDQAGRFPSLSSLCDFRYGDGSLLDHTQAVMDAVLADPPPTPPRDTVPAMTPWWSPMPALYAAALLQHVGLPIVVGRRRGVGSRLTPHARDSAVEARRVLRELGLPFVVREHAVSLVLHQRKPLDLPPSGNPAQTYLRLSCCLDLRALYWLRAAEAGAWGDDATAVQRLSAFRTRAEKLSVFGQPYAPPAAAVDLVADQCDDPAEAQRLLNAMRYFALAARMREPAWCRERIRQEADMPRGRLHLLIGPAGSGKSQWAEENLAQTEIVSSDRMREELTGDPADQSQNYLVFQRCMDRARKYLQDGAEVTFDATNYTRTLRAMPLQAARWSAAEIVSYFFDVGLAETVSRDGRRHRRVPPDIIRKQHRLLEAPALYEADRQFVVDADGHARQYWPTAS